MLLQDYLICGTLALVGAVMVVIPALYPNKWIRLVERITKHEK